MSESVRYDLRDPSRTDCSHMNFQEAFVALARIAGGDIPRHGKPWTSPGALIVRALSGTVGLSAAEGARLRFGRAPEPKTEAVFVGENDLRVSRTHGVLEYRQRWWWLRNTGTLAIEMSGGYRIHRADEPYPLNPGYTTLIITGTNDRKHVLEVRINDAEGTTRVPLPDGRTLAPRAWPLTQEQRLVLVVLGQRYLSKDPDPSPLPRQDVADQLNELQPGQHWDVKRVDRVVEKVRRSLRDKGVKAGLFEDEVEKPLGVKLSHNLMVELTVTTATLTPADLALLGELE
ncbi:FHA domain-containing protein [Allorhizocola rhizosphaerae]|uniref:FHA domain-containing protein n=1 Tax=Allorhizocola rhizosphaerae TaxID=1872709 RepID=UPI0013C32F4B|nr:FHA domain-containing protein [Allorhizocola rhizosphaerae]